MSSLPLSIILPNYNHAKYLPRCLEAILTQSFKDFELIIVDDGSTDNSMEVLESYAQRDKRVKLYQNPENRGVEFTLNRALSLARGEYVHGAASDDYVLPGYFESAMELLRKNPDAGMCVALTRCITATGQEKCVVPGIWANEPTFLSPNEAALRMTECGVPGPAIWRRQPFVQAGGYLSELRWHCDWFTLQVVAFRHGVCFLPQVYSVVRMVTGSYSNNQHRQPEAQTLVLQLLLKRLQSEQYRDVIPQFELSGIFRQFGPILLRAALTMDSLSDHILPLFKDLFFAQLPDLIRDLDPRVRAGTATFLGRFGKQSLYHDLHLGELIGDSTPSVSRAALEAWNAIRVATPRLLWLKHRARRITGRGLRAFDRLSRPLHHTKLDRQEALLQATMVLNREILIGVNALIGEMQSLNREIAKSRRRTARSKISHQIK